MRMAMPEPVEIPATGSMRVPVRIFTDDRLPPDKKAVEQLILGACLEGVVHVIGTPDIHPGYGVPIGCILATTNTVIPAAAGYDINCGMQMILTDLPGEPQVAAELAHLVKDVVPLGEGKSNIRLAPPDFEAVLTRGLSALDDMDLQQLPLGKRLRNSIPIRRLMDRVENRGCWPANIADIPVAARNRGHAQLGTLGGGNHFIEFQRVSSVLDPETAADWNIPSGKLAVMIHSGSRGFGHAIASDYLKGNEIRTLRADSKDGITYLNRMHCAANFACVNRYLVGSLVCNVIQQQYPDTHLELLCDISHNMVSQEAGLYVHRKGATRAWGPGRTGTSRGQPVLIPGSMGTASYVLEGMDGSAKTLHSVNHGAGRVMGRREALGTVRKGTVIREPGVSVDAFRNSMAGIELICENPRTIREEAPQAYKDIDVVIDAVTRFGLARPVVRLKPLAVLKG